VELTTAIRKREKGHRGGGRVLRTSIKKEKRHNDHLLFRTLGGGGNQGKKDSPPSCVGGKEIKGGKIWGDSLQKGGGGVRLKLGVLGEGKLSRRTLVLEKLKRAD